MKKLKKKKEKKKKKDVNIRENFLKKIVLLWKKMAILKMLMPIEYIKSQKKEPRLKVYIRC